MAPIIEILNNVNYKLVTAVESNTRPFTLNSSNLHFSKRSLHKVKKKKRGGRGGVLASEA